MLNKKFLLRTKSLEVYYMHRYEKLSLSQIGRLYSLTPQGVHNRYLNAKPIFEKLTKDQIRTLIQVNKIYDTENIENGAKVSEIEK